MYHYTEVLLSMSHIMELMQSGFYLKIDTESMAKEK